MTTTDTAEPTFNDRLAKRLNDSVQALADGRLMQNPRPFSVGWRGEIIMLDASPRDIEILADILEAVERGSFAAERPTYLPTPGQTSLPVG